MDIDADRDEPLRAILASGDPLGRRAVGDALRAGGIAVVAEAGTGAEAIELTTFYRPDLIVMDVDVKDPDGIEATRVISGRAPNVRIVLLAADSEDPVGIRAIRAGASGYLSRVIEPDVLARAVRASVEGEAAISRRLTMMLMDATRTATRAGAGLRPVRSALTDREWEVLDLMASGARTDEVARTLVLSTETVRSHMKNLYRKLGVRSRDEAVEAAARMRDLVG